MTPASDEVCPTPNPGADARQAAGFVEVAMRLGELFLHELHQFAMQHSLDIVHLRAIAFLNQANRYSNTATALGDYLGLTKGTLSKSIAVLARRGLVHKVADPRDRRITRLHLTHAGQALQQQLIVHLNLPRIAATQTPDALQDMTYTLTRWLSAHQGLNQRKPFGVCRTCQHFQTTPTGYLCALTQEPLSEPQSHKLCREHSPATSR